MNKRQEGASQLVIVGGDPAEDLDLIEKALGRMPFLGDLEIAGLRFGAILLWWDCVVGHLLVI